MKKMPYAILFILIVVILVFAGCKALSGNHSDDPSEDPANVSETTDAAETTTDPIGPLVSEFEVLTGEDGSTLFSEDDIASIYNELASSIAAEAESSRAAASDPSSSEEQTTEKPDESTAAAPDTTAAQPEDTTAPAEDTTAAVSTANEYDILRSGKFYLDGSMYSAGETNPVTLAVGDDLLYMQATMDNITLGMLMAGKKTYMLSPANKTYCEFGSVISSVLKQAGMMSEDDIKDMIDSMGFSSMEDLDKADSKTTGTIGSTACDVYIFNKADGSKTRVYMNGSHLLAFEVVNTEGVVESATYITTLTADIPTLPPEDYEKQNAITFMMAMEEIMGD